MDRRVKNRSFTRKAGMQVPKHILRELARRHPTIRIVWSHQAKQWLLLQDTADGAHFVHAFSGLPTLGNTVRVLDAAHWSNWQNEQQVQRQLDEIDNAHLDPSRVADNQERVREGSKALFNRLTNRKVIRVRP